ncbi:MAG: hypothetical protein B6D54_03015 [Epsilonproteobacteria bacterium 4484_65]|nr:MAG: hypothetical protein B6D54_03015 [Epsilonproteobacteria bacterium 4484_65]
MSELEQKAIDYLNENKQVFLEHYSQGIEPSEKKYAIFTAGMSGVGKTETSETLGKEDKTLLHIDTDKIRDFFRPVGYDGQNSDLFQKAASRGFNELFNYAMKNGYSMILDTNLASIGQAKQNIERLLKRGYNIEITYLYNHPDICYEYAVSREVVTHRKVPLDVFERSNINSYKTVLEIKSFYKEKVILHFLDKRDDSVYANIDEAFLKEQIGANFETK